MRTRDTEWSAMQNNLVHEIELYPPEVFKTIVDHEVNRSRRYGDSLSLVDMVVETDPSDAQAQHRAELFTIHALAVQLREPDIPCKKGNEFLILMPATGQAGTRTACERVRRSMYSEPELNDQDSFKVSTFIG